MAGSSNDVSLSFDSNPSLTAVQHRRPAGAASGSSAHGVTMGYTGQGQGSLGYPGQGQGGLGYPGQAQGPLGYQGQGYAQGQGQGHGQGPVPYIPQQAVQQGQGQAGAPPPNMAFMSFDLSNTGGFPPPSRVGGPMGNGNYGASVSLASQGFFEDEPPLLEELGINVPQIIRKTISALNPIRVNPDLFEDGELSGPLMFIVLFGLLQLLSGKVHFGVLLGWSAASSVLLWAVVNLLSGGDVQLSGIELYRCCSLFGYSLLPMVAFSAISLFLPHKGFVLSAVSAATVLWCSRTCSSLMVTLLPQSEDFNLLVVYLCVLIYSAFALLVVF